MSAAESKAGPGQDVPGPQGTETDVTQALTGFLSDFRDFQGDIKQQLHKQEERLTMLDRKTMIKGRPALGTTSVAAAPHQMALEAYVRSGNDEALRGLQIEGKAMNSAVDSNGGYLVDPQTSSSIQSVLSGGGSLRQIANVVTVEASSYDVLVDRGDLQSGWATETDPATETQTPTFERIEIPLHELSALPKASQRLLDDAAVNIETWLADRISEKFAQAEADAFVIGDGQQKPTGFLSYTVSSNPGWGELGYVPTGLDGDFAGADAIIELVYALGAPYRANGTFVMNSQTAGAVRRLKDNDGRFMWADGLAAGEPARLLGYPVLICEAMPDMGAGENAVAFGDFHKGYTIAERPDIRVLRDPFSAKPNVLFYATKRIGGDVTDFDAIKVLRFSAS